MPTSSATVIELLSTISTTWAGCTAKYVVKWVVPDGGSFSTSCATPAEVPSANDPATSAQVNNDSRGTLPPQKNRRGASTRRRSHHGGLAPSVTFLEFYRLIGRNRRVKPSGMADWRVTRQGVDAVAEFRGARGWAIPESPGVAGETRRGRRSGSHRAGATAPRSARSRSARIPGTNTLSGDRGDNPSRARRACRPASLSTARPWLWSTTAARSRRRSRRLQQGFAVADVFRDHQPRAGREPAACRLASWMPTLVPVRRPGRRHRLLLATPRQHLHQRHAALGDQHAGRIPRSGMPPFCEHALERGATAKAPGTDARSFRVDEHRVHHVDVRFRP